MHLSASARTCLRFLADCIVTDSDFDYSTERLLSPGGAIARRLPDFEARPQQIEMALAVERAIAQRQHLIAEAGTGTGKSFAYLLPAVAHADAHQGEGPIVIATRTIALQEQLLKKDLPLLHAALPFEWTSVTAIGRNNYLCLRRMHHAQREAGLFDDPANRQQLRTIVDWSVHTREGTRFDLATPPLPAVWDEVQAEHGNCLNRACKHYDPCHWQKARRRMQTAQVLVVNHALYFADVALRMMDAAYLPPHRVVIFDEAHHLERTATESIGLRASARTVGWHLRRLHQRRSEHSLLARFGSKRAQGLWDQAQAENDAFFARLASRLQTARGGNEGAALGDETLSEGISQLLTELAEELTTAAATVVEVDARMELQSRCSGLHSLCHVLRSLCGPTERAGTALVRWIEPSRHGPVLCGAPLDVSGVLREHLWESGITAILTSATLGPSDDAEFAWLRRQLGLDAATTLRVGSPFDYDRAVEFHVEEAMPDPSTDPSNYLRECGERSLRWILENDGHALVLCTSWAFVRELAVQLREKLQAAGIALLVQGEAPLSRLLQQKLAEPRSVLLGTDSLWEGIDLRGDALTLVVVTRLPFQSPGHPLTQARLQAIRARGGEPFAEHSLPEAILKFRQGFGRLIRSGSDRGKVVVMDPRLRTKAYGRRFLASLPFRGNDA